MGYGGEDLTGFETSLQSARLAEEKLKVGALATAMRRPSSASMASVSVIQFRISTAPPGGNIGGDVGRPRILACAVTTLEAQGVAPVVPA